MSARSEKRIFWYIVFVLGAITALLPITSGRSSFYFLDVPGGIALMVIAYLKARRLRRRMIFHSFTQE